MPAHALMPLADPRPVRVRRVRPSSAQLDYLWKIALEEVSKASRATYRARLKHFSNWLGIEADLLPVLILQSDPASFRVSAQEYREALETGPMAPATANLTLAALSRIIGRLHEARLIDWTYRAKAFSVEPARDTAGPSADATRALLAAAVTGQADPFRPARDEALIRLALSLGLRRSELVRLDLEDVREGRGGRLQIEVRGKGKAGKKPLVVPDNAAAALRRWLQVREGFASRGAPRPLFIRLTPAARARRVALRLSDEGVAHILERLRKHAGIEEKIRAHGLRHHAITALLESGATLAYTVAFARHSDPKTTMVYWDNQQQAAAKAARVVDSLY